MPAAYGQYASPSNQIQGNRQLIHGQPVSQQTMNGPIQAQAQSMQMQPVQAQSMQAQPVPMNFRRRPKIPGQREFRPVNKRAYMQRCRIFLRLQRRDVRQHAPIPYSGNPAQYANRSWGIAMNFSSSIERAAVLVRSLNEQQATKLLALLEPQELNQLSRAIKSLGDVDQRQQDLAVIRLIEAASCHKDTFAGERHNHSEVETPFGYLVNTTAAMRRALLVDEHPRVVAVVLVTLPIQVASEVLKFS